MTDQKVLITNYMIKGNGIGELVLVELETGNWFIISDKGRLLITE